MELDRAAVERVLRRAGELDGGQGAGDTVPEAVVLEAAAEVGLDADAVRVALAIERLGPPPPVSTADRLFGPPVVGGERVVGVPVAAALDRLDDLLVREHQLRPTRARGQVREWRRKDGPIGSLQRAAKSLAGDATLSKARRVEAAASAVDGERTVLRVAVDRSKERSGIVAGSAVAGGVVLSGTVVAGIVLSPFVLAAAPLAALAAGGVARVGHRQAEELEDCVEDVLEAVDQGTVPVTITESLRATIAALRPARR